MAQRQGGWRLTLTSDLMLDDAMWSIAPSERDRPDWTI